MKKIILAIIINLLCFLNYGNAQVKSENITFPKHFYTEQIEVCLAAGNESFKSSYTKSKIESLINLDWMSEWAKGNSRSVNHENLTGPMTLFSVTTHTAIGNNDKEEINLAKNVLIQMAKANILYDTIGREELKEKPRCWKDGNPEAPCWYHAYEFARDALTNYTVSYTHLTLPTILRV